MSNILNHNRNLIDFILVGEDYWDFHLSEDMGYSGVTEGLTEKCLSAYIDFNDSECVLFDDAFSKSKYVWENAINDNVDLNYIGLTGVDNGFISYQKDRISNKEFLELFLHSSFNTSEDGKRFRVRRVNGNNQIYDYSNDLVTLNDIEVSRLNGGFYQGFFKIYEKEYQTLPYVIENGWSFEITLNKNEFVNKNTTINDAHPLNKGMFLYIGTRSENKWLNKYNLEKTFDKSPINYNSDEYFEYGYTTESENVNSQYTEKEDDYLKEVFGDDKCSQNEMDICNQYVNDEYLEKVEEISGDEAIQNEDGIDITKANIIRYETDNKFLLFNRTKEGFTTRDWEEGSIAVMYDTKKPDVGNYFELFNRTPNGYTTRTIDKLIDEKSNGYNVLKDIYRNALGFQIKDDGSVGYKYLVKDCDSEEENYKIEEEFSNSGVINDGIWYTVSVKIMPTRARDISNPICGGIETSSIDEMVIYIYVNGKLILKSKNLPMLNLKALDDLSEKQQSIPFSLSIGGGTQGLCDVININYRETPKYLLPLEKEFCGSFVGYIKDFRFYSCPLNFTQIVKNYEYDVNNRK